MKNKKSLISSETILIILIFLFLVVSSFLVFNNLSLEKTSYLNSENEKFIYQGPVQIGVDEQHFRETGETIYIGEENKWKN